MNLIESLTFYSKIATTFYPLIPLYIVVGIFKKMGAAYRVFVSFILLSFVSDVFGFLIYFNKPALDNFVDVKYAVYSLFDGLLPLLFLWMINATHPRLRQWIKGSAAFLSFIWIYSYCFNNPTFESSSMFDFSYCIVNSLLAASCLLLLAEEGAGLKHFHDFWFLSGLFFYFFCANFMMTLVSTTIGKEIWVLHNIIALLSYALFTNGFLVLRKSLIP